jgi:hypothetical protein
MITLLAIRLSEAAAGKFAELAERVRRSHHDAISELQRLPLAGARIIRDVTLADSTWTPIAHGMGRPVFVFVSPPRGAVTTGRIAESRDGTVDRAKFVQLAATGWGATVTVDLLVVP